MNQYQPYWDELMRVSHAKAIGIVDLPRWGVFDVGEREVHVCPLTEVHSLSRLCECGQRIEVGDGYLLVIHELRR